MEIFYVSCKYNSFINQIGIFLACETAKTGYATVGLSL